MTTVYTTKELKNRRGPAWYEVLTLGIMASTVIAVFVYVLAMRLEPVVLALLAIATIACVVAVLAIAALAFIILRRNGKQNGQYNERLYTTTPPQIMVVPPMSIPHYPQLGTPPQFDPLLRQHQQLRRHFTVVGEGSDDEFWSGA